MSFAILGLGTAVPPTIIDQTDALNIARRLCCRTDEHATWLPAMYGNTGIRRRHLALGADVVRDVLDGTRASGSPFLPTGRPDDRGPTTAERVRHYVAAAAPLALAAARLALDRAGRRASAVTHLVTVSCTGFHAPGVDVELIQGLGLPPDTQRTHVGYMGCHGSLNGLRVARAFTGAEPDACVLLCATELCSLHYHYGWDPQKMVANALFADGAAAVVGAAPGPADGGTWQLAASGSCVFPGSTDAKTWTSR
jgi:predicted naringenin-chalcone synthase